MVGEVIPIEISSEMKKSYLAYAMSVIVARAIPDVNDGLKPVHRRILYSMYENGYDYNKSFKKCARIVGDVMGKYHPHGDSSIYEALVRMAQDFSMSSVLIQGQGNFGSIDDDPAAAMRYTEARMAKLSHTMTDDLDKNTVNFVPNYDGTEYEPDVLPSSFPNLLVNGGSGIAVGMATNVPTHNLGEVIDGVIAYIDNNDITCEDLLKLIPCPDFPTGGLIVGKGGYLNVIRTGRGTITMRGEARIEEMKNGKEQIIITSLPYQVVKKNLISKIAELVKEKRIEGITDLRDESTRDVRIVIEVKRDGNSEVILSQLYSYTDLQCNFSSNILALNNGKPENLGVFDVIKIFTKFREKIVTKRTEFLLSKAREKAHVLIGLRVAVNEIDEIIKLIKAAKDTTEARNELMSRSWDANVVESLIKLIQDRGNKIEDGKFYFTETQARAILDMRLSKLTGLESNKIDDELKELANEIQNYLRILSNRNELMDIIKNELLKIKEDFAEPRKTKIIDAESDIDIEELIEKEDMIVITTMNGYIKRVSTKSYKSQKRGGKGKSAINIHDDDYITNIFAVNTHTPILFFSNKGKVYKMKTYKLPEGSSQSKGRAIVNILPLGENESITTILAIEDKKEERSKNNIIFATNKGDIRRNSMEDFENIQSNGKIAMKLGDDEKLVGVAICDDNSDIMLSTKLGKCIRFKVDALRIFQSRNSTGVRGIKLDALNEVISISVLKNSETNAAEERDAYLNIDLITIRSKLKNLSTSGNIQEIDKLINDIPSDILKILNKEKIVAMAKDEEFILTICENGYGKRTSAYEYRVTGRGGTGITNIITSGRNGNVVNSFPAEDEKDIIIISNKGTAIRQKISDIRIVGRNTQGVTLMKTANDETVISVVEIERDEDSDSENDAENSYDLLSGDIPPTE
ncbi:MAG: DNA gyrase subunit A [Rickettsiales bacterium]|jgi:DNA gyrase subunit A|nr:DNA gyrase subunit A [Rickettsiales bacterium]